MTFIYVKALCNICTFFDCSDACECEVIGANVFIESMKKAVVASQFIQIFVNHDQYRVLDADISNSEINFYMFSMLIYPFSGL